MKIVSRSARYYVECVNEILFVEDRFDASEVYFETWSNGYKAYETMEIDDVFFESVSQVLDIIGLHSIDVNVVIDFINFG